jgi:cytochrome c biogenesis protein CcmG, thiol:disulfide interchange protein DsbE
MREANQRHPVPASEPRPEVARRRTLRVATIALPFIAAALLTALYQLRSAGPNGGDAPTVAERLATARADGRPAPNFELPALGSRGTVSLRDYAGYVVVLNFWASWCAPCREEAPVLQSLWTEYRPRGVRFLGINHRDARPEALAFQREFGITYPSGFDPRGSLATTFGLVGLPTTFVVREDGGIAYTFTGKVGAPALRGALEDVLEGSSAGP